MAYDDDDNIFGLNPKERQYVLSHPGHANAIRKSKAIAFAETQKVFGYNGMNDWSDAFRHCFWAAILARDIGYEGAIAFTSAHESPPNNPVVERTMDLHNNFKGAEIGRNGGTNQALSQRCSAALFNRELISEIKNGNLFF
jgi:hypothetical protein